MTIKLADDYILQFTSSFTLEPKKAAFGLNPLDWTKCVRVSNRIFSPERGQKGSCHENTKKVPSRI